MGLASKAFFNALAASSGIKKLVSRYGLRRPHSFARRFVAGQTTADAIAVAREIEASGMTQTLDYLGPAVATMAEADAATRTCLGVLSEVAAAGIGRSISLTPTQLGLTVDRATCVDNLRRLLDPAAAQGFFIRMHMEDSRYTQVSFDIFETLLQQGYRNVGVTLQAYLPRSVEDARRMNQLGAQVRLVKGAYLEPRGVAYRSRVQVDNAFVEIMRLLLSEGTSPAIATHDPAIIGATRRFASERQIPSERYEFQMRYGIRRELQRTLAAEGYRVRISVPFGHEWFRYVMERLGERPANLAFVARSLLGAPADRRLSLG